MPQCYLAASKNLLLIFRYLTIIELFVLQLYKINNCHYNSLCRLDNSEHVAIARAPSRGLPHFSARTSCLMSSLVARFKLSMADCDYSMSAFYARLRLLSLRQDVTRRGGRLRKRPVNFSHSVAAQTSVVAWPKMRMMVATLVAVSMSGAVKMST